MTTVWNGYAGGKWLLEFKTEIDGDHNTLAHNTLKGGNLNMQKYL